MPRKSKLVIWDVDGPINHGVPKSRDECYLPEDRTEGSRPGAYPTDFVVDNKKMLALTMQILHENDVTSVIGSQRIQMKDEDPYYGRFLTAMYKGLDHVFGKDRVFLKEDIARQVGQTLQESETNKSKNVLIKAYQEALGLNPEDIVFIDDHVNYAQSTRDAGHVFVHAPRTKPLDTVEDNSYLFETLLRTVGVDDIRQSLARSVMPTSIKNQYQQQLVTYQQDNLKEVISWQAKIIAERRLSASTDRTEVSVEAKDHDQAAKQVLRGIQHLITHTKWNLGYFGGVKIVDNATGVQQVVPKGMGKVIEHIQLAQEGKKPWKDTLVEVERIINESTERKNHGFFNKRGESTQVFYEELKKMIKAPQDEADVQDRNAPKK